MSWMAIALVLLPLTLSANLTKAIRYDDPCDEPFFEEVVDPLLCDTPYSPQTCVAGGWTCELILSSSYYVSLPYSISCQAFAEYCEVEANFAWVFYGPYGSSASCTGYCDGSLSIGFIVLIVVLVIIGLGAIGAGIFFFFYCRAKRNAPPPAPAPVPYGGQPGAYGAPPPGAYAQGSQPGAYPPMPSGYAYPQGPPPPGYPPPAYGAPPPPVQASTPV